MSRKILFRGKKLSDKEWVEGYYVAYSSGREAIRRPYVIDSDLQRDLLIEYVIDSETLCQYTGLTDKNGKKIFEGDICKYYNPEDKDGIAVIREDYAEWRSGTIREKSVMTPLFYLKCSEEWEVIGNIFDNPELIDETSDFDIFQKVIDQARIVKKCTGRNPFEI